MKMANHPRPGDIIQESLDELNVSLREFARAMEIAPSTASRLLTGKAALTPEMAIKLSVVIGSSPQMWLNLQNAWSLAEAEKTVDVSRLQRNCKYGCSAVAAGSDFSADRLSCIQGNLRTCITDNELSGIIWKSRYTLVQLL